MKKGPCNNGSKRSRLCASIIACLVVMWVAPRLRAQPTLLDSSLEIELVKVIPGTCLRLKYYEPTGLLYLLSRDGDIWTVNPATGDLERVAVVTDHGIAEPQGFDITPDGDFYLTGNVRMGTEVTGMVLRGRLTPGSVIPSSWKTLATTVPYQLSANYNHLFSATAVDPRGNHVYVASGSRTDHGEVEDNQSVYPGLREVPLTSAILRIPTDTSGLVLLNDTSFLVDNDYQFADGVRNEYGLAFDPDGLLFGIENSSDRDDEDELNWFRKGLHYGFPWRLGTNDNPQQFADYDPTSDLLVNPKSAGAQLHTFVNDPAFPPPPEGITFVDPVPNLGPDLTRFKDPETGAIEDGASRGIPIGTFTPHVTPVGLVFDVQGDLAEPYTRDGFFLGWNQSDTDLFEPFDEVGQSVYHLKLHYDPTRRSFEVETTRIVESLEMPVDAVLVDTTLYVMEIRLTPEDAKLWAVRFPKRHLMDPQASDPKVLVPDVTVENEGPIPMEAIRIEYDKVSNGLFYATRNGDIYRRDIMTGQVDLAASSSDHSTTHLRAMAVSNDGKLYLLGNRNGGTTTSGVVRRARLDGGIPVDWETVAVTEPYPLAGNPSDHLMGGLAVSPDARTLFVASGSRTDHGEVQDNAGEFPDLREAPLTSILLRLPSDASNLDVPNDKDKLKDDGLVFAEGFRNVRDLAWDPNGLLIGTDESGERDDPDELNWIREGRHYGFPWKLGPNETPQQAPDYEPAEDPLIGPGSQSTFTNDPNYPSIPNGVVFESPLANTGPDADHFREPASGVLLDASDGMTSIATFTSHRSPVGLVFDTAGVLADPFTGDGFVLSSSGRDSPSLYRLDDSGQDLLHLDMQWSDIDSTYSVSSNRIIEGFRRPIDAVLVGSDLYVIEMGLAEDDNPSLWKISLPHRPSTEAVKPDYVPPKILSLEFYPNPVRSAGRFVLRTSDPGQVVINLFDVEGRLVRRVTERYLHSGTFEISVNLEGLPAGVYVGRVQVAEMVKFMEIVRVD